MTYPPQQPPGPYGPQDPYGQQQPPYGQQPYGPPQGQYGPGAPQGQYGPGTPWAGQQPGYPVGPPPPKKKTGLITSLIIVAILVVGGGGVGAYFLLKNDDKNNSGDGGGGGDTPRSAADSYASALGTALSTRLENVDLKPLKPLTCADDFTELTDSLDDARKYESATQTPKPDKATFGVTDFKETGDGATFKLTQKVGTKENDPRDMDVLKEQGAWKVCGLFEDQDGGGSGGETSRGSGPSSGGDGGAIPNPIPKTS